MPLQGKLQESPVSDIVQLIQLSKQTGALQIRADVRANGTGQLREDSGRIYFANGRIVYATLYDLPAEEALLTFFTFHSGDFTFNTGEVLPPGAEPLTIGNEFAIMRGVERDEETELNAAAFPSDDIVPLITQNQTSGASLKAEEWRLLTFLNGQDDIATIARRSGTSLFRTRTILRRLLDAGLVVKQERKKTNFVLYAELDRIVLAQMRTARQLLDDAYRRLNIRIDDPITFEQAAAIADEFRKRAGLLVGPGRATAIHEQMMERISAVFGG